MKKLFIIACLFFAWQFKAEACTGISMFAADGTYIQARTIEWGGSNLNSVYVVVPRNFNQVSFTPTGKNGMSFNSKYGYVGLAVEEKEFIAEGVNEAGLSAGLFYYPNYGSYQLYDEKYNSITVADLQLVSYLLSQFATVDEVKAGMDKIRVVSLMGGDGAAEAIHWRVGDSSGKQIVIEIEQGVVHIYDNTIGVLTNAPNFHWHLTNLNNYVNLTPVNTQAHNMGDVKVFPFSFGSGFLGLPGDFTPPSRFVRAAFFKTTAPMMKDARSAMLQCFTILNNFDIPIGMEYPKGQTPDLPSATQWTSVIDLTHKVVYYKTFNNNSIRKIDLGSIDFTKVKYQYHVLDEANSQPVQTITIS
ncbi:MAG: choloylglycine hydrolase family protein [Bacteroidales bacterium]|nr:choloylglycine hydrolase family protein [Bacteroidales bacterium]